MSTVPKHRPILNSGLGLITTQRALLTEPGCDGARVICDCQVYILAIRMLVDGKDVVGVYNDVIAAVHRDGREIVVVNGNTDPSRFGPSPLAKGKDEARIRPGVWPMIKGHHGDLPHCIRQPNHDQARALQLEHYFPPPDRRALGEFTVDRMAKDGSISKTETGTFNTNFHPGGQHGTSSAGCQTAPEPQYGEIRDALYRWTNEAAQLWIPYVLVLGPL